MGPCGSQRLAFSARVLSRSRREASASPLSPAVAQPPPRRSCLKLSEKGSTGAFIFLGGPKQRRAEGSRPGGRRVLLMEPGNRWRVVESIRCNWDGS